MFWHILPLVGLFFKGLALLDNLVATPQAVLIALALL
jgi:hypothetical protein